MAFEHWITAEVTGEIPRERVTVYADDWRRLQSERAELLAALEAAWHRCRCAGGEQDCESCFEVRDLIARVRA